MTASALVILTADPLNAETPLHEQLGVITPTPRHYVRSHFAVPAWPGRLAVGGAVRRPREYTLAEIEAMSARSELVTLECAGNGRSFVDPPCPGEQWGLGAVSTAEWTGVPLADLLAAAEPDARAVEVLFAGADRGTPKDVGREIAFERSLPITDARTAGALIAYAMNGERLAPDHGAPLRLVVPGRYGMASVKWLAEIRVLDEPFRGFFQADRYVIDGRALDPIAPRAIIVSPREGAKLAKRPTRVHGYAWSGATPVTRVELSDDGGASWDVVDLAADRGDRAWRQWQHAWTPPSSGEATLLARATDATGAQQPLADVRNTLGYMNNAAQPVRILIG